MKGLDFRTTEIKEMNNYIVITSQFNYENDYLDLPLNKGADSIRNYLGSIIETLEAGKDYHLMIALNNVDELDYEDLMTFYSIFSYTLSEHGNPINNNMNYLGFNNDKAKPLRKNITCTDYTLLKLMNHNYNYGTIQLTVIESNGSSTSWVTY